VNSFRVPEEEPPADCRLVPKLMAVFAYTMSFTAAMICASFPPRLSFPVLVDLIAGGVVFSIRTVFLSENEFTLA